MVDRRTLLKVGCFGAVVLGGGLLVKRFLGAGGPFGTAPEGSSELDWIAAHLVPGGPPPDGIPPIEDPRYISPTQAEDEGLVHEASVVDGWVSDDGPLVAPRRITVWHEIVWTHVAGQAAAVTYCPLTGSTVGYRGQASGGEPLTFGTSGKLYNNNLVMYDRQTDSLWPQILGRAVQGPLKGQRLGTFPVFTTTWADWKAQHPETRVLSRDTGFRRDYDRDPYGGYDGNRQTYFPNAADWRESDVPLHPKDEVFGLTRDDHHLAAEKRHLRDQGVLEAELGGRPVAILHDDALDTARPFDPTVDGENLTLEPVGSRFRDLETASTWTAEGRAVSGELEGKRLDPVPTFEVFWFAWYAYFPDTDVLL